MSELLERLRSQLSELMGRLSRQQKLILGGSLVAVIVSLVAFVYLAGRPDYVPLFQNLDPADAGAIQAKLKEQKVNFQVSEDGKSILVPSKDQASLRLDLANSGLPKGTGWGFETFNESRFGETEKEKDIRLKIATETELSRTLQNIPGVENARVMVVPAADSLFKGNATDATASVMLILKPYAKLEEKQVRGIIHLVSKSVKQLKPENVTVVDNSGNVLSEGLFTAGGTDKASLDGLAKTQLQVKKDFESNLEQKAQDMLNRALGAGNAVVKVSTELDFSQQEVKDVKLGKPVPLSTRETEEAGQGSSAAGTPGTSANIPTQQAANNNTSSYSKTDSIVNNEIPKTETHTVTPPGSSLKRLSVSVMVNRTLTPEETQQLEKAVAQAVGIRYPIQQPTPGQPERVEQISVLGMAFDRSAVDEMNRLADEQKAFQRYLMIGGAVLVLALLVAAGLLARRAYLRRKPAPEPEPLPSLAFDTSVPTPPVPELSPEELEKLALREKIEDLSDNDPEAVARLLKTWLADESR
ncbi:flagellar M-ring protein FliF [Heliobacterium gestii]|uniref:Flagellar M-ring protein n=1 Tax=Heliomicrobium gestii TaxID=2699 RepID=A0A845LD47_HELGE|nr:flagellar basal-body MS-ring/collar protein FliF [Heliomicrobium gestii]MBM7867105.1 flagellar M-ring protein FliF [Heliomicrobium gestii]MZP43481.1 flagellar M-ring protein FliF [Heliomicrobium gestii]